MSKHKYPEGAWVHQYDRHKYYVFVGPKMWSIDAGGLHMRDHKLRALREAGFTRSAVLTFCKEYRARFLGLTLEERIVEQGRTTKRYADWCDDAVRNAAFAVGADESSERDLGELDSTVTTRQEADEAYSNFAKMIDMLYSSWDYERIIDLILDRKSRS